MSPQRAINYARVSTPKQAELYSLDYQLEQERGYDAELGLSVVKEFAEDKSGRKMDTRDQLEEACQLLERDEADILVVWRFDRLHRNYVNSVVLRDRIRKVGKEIQYAQSRMVSGKTARQRLPEDLQYIMAEIEADDISERTNGGKRRKIEVGQKWLGLNKPPFGYTKQGSGQESTLVINEATAGIVRDIFRWYIAGDTGRPMSVREITERLTARGIPTPIDSDSSYAHLKTRGYAQWGRSTVYTILKDESYTGVFYHYRWKRVNGHMTHNRNREEWRAVPIPAIIDQETWEAAKRRMAVGLAISPRNNHHDYLVSRRIQCECGYRMRTTTMQRTKTLKDGSTPTYTYQEYLCPGRKTKFGMARTCDMPVLNVKTVDAQVWQWVKEDIGQPEILERKLRETQANQYKEHEGTDATIATLTGHKQQIEEELRRLAMLYARNTMPSHLLDQLIAEQNQKLGLTVKEIAKLEESRAIPLTDDVISGLVEFSAEFAKHLEATEQTFEGRRTVVDGLDVQVVVFRKNGEIWLRLTSILRPQGHELSLLITPTIS